MHHQKFSDLQLITNQYNVKQETTERLIGFLTTKGLDGEIEMNFESEKSSQFLS